MENIDWSSMGAAVVAAGSAVVAAYQDFSTAPTWKKAVMIAGPAVIILFVLTVLS